MTMEAENGEIGRINEIIAKNIRLLREKYKLSLDALAKISGVSKSMLAQMERGKVNPTLITLWKLSNGLKIPFTELISMPLQSVELVRGEKRAVLLEDEGRFRNIPLFGFDEKRRFEMYHIEMDPGCAMAAGAHPEGSEEIVAIFSGTMTMTVRGETFRLGGRDALRFAADAPHTYANDGEEICRLSMVIYYPRREQ